jgi:alkylation response protein AidB-like acyl-CoA dehydrogenase
MLLSSTQQAITDAVRAFAQVRIAPHAQRFEAQGSYPPELFRELADLGLMAMTAPEADIQRMVIARSLAL